MLHTLSTEVVYGSVEAPLVALEALYASKVVIIVLETDTQTTACVTRQNEVCMLSIHSGSINIGLGKDRCVIMPRQHILTTIIHDLTLTVDSLTRMEEVGWGFCACIG